MPINVFDDSSMFINFLSQDDPYFRKIIFIEFYFCFCFYFELKDIVLHESEEKQRLGEISRIHIVLMIPSTVPQSPHSSIPAKSSNFPHDIVEPRPFPILKPHSTILTAPFFQPISTLMPRPFRFFDFFSFFSFF